MPSDRSSHPLRAPESSGNAAGTRARSPKRLSGRRRKKRGPLRTAGDWAGETERPARSLGYDDPDDEADEEDDPDRILPRLALVVQGLLRKTLGLAEPLQEKGLHIHRRKGSERGISEERHDPGTGETSG